MSWTSNVIEPRQGEDLQWVIYWAGEGTRIGTVYGYWRAGGPGWYADVETAIAAFLSKYERATETFLVVEAGEKAQHPGRVLRLRCSRQVKYSTIWPENAPSRDGNEATSAVQAASRGEVALDGSRRSGVRIWPRPS